jgi:predicted phosphodiesterase
MNKDQYRKLLKYCESDTQKTRILALMSCPTISDAARTLGIHTQRLSETLNVVSAKAYKDLTTEGDVKSGRSGGEVVGIIGDTHLPYELMGYMDWVKSVFDSQGVTKVIHIGDLFDHHALSFHDSEPSLKGSRGEYIDALEHLEPWKKTFPQLTLIHGNHDQIPARQMKKAGLNPEMFMRPLAHVYDFPRDWVEVEDIEIDGVLYHHGHTSMGVNGFRNDAKARMQNTVSGHCHGNLGISWTASHHRLVWGMAVGCGIDNKKMAFAYGKHFKNKPIVGCGVVKHGKTPLVFAMDLGEH